MINSLRLVFGRVRENSQGRMDELSPDGSIVADFHNNATSCEITCTISMDTACSFKEGLLRAGVKQGDKQFAWSGQDEQKKTGSWFETGPGADLYNRVFTHGWPRAVSMLEQKAFKGREDMNSELFRKHWAEISKDARDYLGIELGSAEALVVDRKPTCVACQSRPERKGLGMKLTDSNGAPLLQGSDGIAHFLFLIMETRKHEWPTTFLVEEPDVFMHPGLQKEYLRYLVYVHEQKRHQFFVSTHSPYLLGAAVEHAICGQQVHVYRLAYEDGATQVEKRELADNRSGWQLLNELGHRPADVMHPNAILWVEGPSDVIYAKHWLDRYAQNCRNAEPIRWGRECEVLWYGGSNIANLGFDDTLWENLDEPRLGALVDLCKTHPNAAIVIDRDKGLNDGKKGASKKRVIDEFAAQGQPCWPAGGKGNSIEDYVGATLQDECGTPTKSNGRKTPKVHAAQKYVERCKGLHLLDTVDTSTDIEEQLRRLYDWIRPANQKA